MPSLSRRAIAQQLVALQTEIEPALGKIDALKEDLRQIAEQDGQGFTEQLEGGSVEVKASRARELKGILPELKPEAFLALPQGRQEKLIEQGLVAMVQQWSPAARPSVTVRVG
jgi:pyridoxine 5'-phosphate synthase PdxJ